MSNDEEFSRLETFVKFLENKNKTNSGILGAAKNMYNSFFHLRFFEFIPKDQTIKTKENINLSLDLLCIAKTYNIKSYIFGFNFMYFAFIFNKDRRIFSPGVLLILGATSSLILLQQYLSYNKIFKVLDPLFSNDIKYLYTDIKRKREGYDEKVLYNNLDY
jgi:hypothetical protein